MAESQISLLVCDKECNGTAFQQNTTRRKSYHVNIMLQYFAVGRVSLYFRCYQHNSGNHVVRPAHRFKTFSIFHLWKGLTAYKLFLKVVMIMPFFCTASFRCETCQTPSLVTLHHTAPGNIRDVCSLKEVILHAAHVTVQDEYENCLLECRAMQTGRN